MGPRELPRRHRLRGRRLRAADLRAGAAGLRGPGAPIEAATSATLPAGETLAYLKLDHAKYETYDADPANPESDYANYWMAGLGYGLTSWFSAYVFLPYHSKVDEPGGFDTHGFADMSLFGQLGFKYDEGFRLIPENERDRKSVV